jgi:phosphoribosylformylglycinamidine (FGAM) synthase-like enzyme
MLIGPLATELGGSIYLDTLGHRGSVLPAPDVDTLKEFWIKLANIQNQAVLRSVSTLAEGGLIRRLFEMGLGGGFGCRINPDELLESSGCETVEPCLFSEMIGAALIETEPDQVDRIRKELNGVLIGSTTDDYTLRLELNLRDVKLSMESLTEQWKRPFRKETT